MIGLLCLIMCAGLVCGQSQNGSASSCNFHCNSCPDSWLVFGESCYYFGHDSGMSFVEAEHFCRQRNSHLVHVDDAMENAFLKDFLGRLQHKHYWMGLSDERIEGIFIWTDDNTRPEFTDWAPGQPDDWGHNEDCAIFWNGHGFLWEDESCSFLALPLCEKKATCGKDLQQIVG